MGEVLSVTFKVNVYVPGVVGVPEISPVVLFNVSPGGSVPELTVQVYGGVPPYAVGVVL